MKKLFFPLIIVAICFSSIAQIPKLNLVQVASGFSLPIDIQHCNDERIFVVEKAGYIRIMSKSGAVSSTPFLDIHTQVNSSGNEQGLLGLAFSPNYKQDGFFYVNYINGAGAGSTRISRFQVSPTDSNVANAASEKVLLSFAQPAANHNGATLMFGADGYLYDTQGDGGGAGDTQGYGQNLNIFHGKILRFDVSNPDTTYTVPSDNPFVGQANIKPEIWAYGLRNPFRCSFDRFTHDMWIGDVGQGLYEEVDFQPAIDTGGQNYGWRCYEGFHGYNLAGCAGSGFTSPIYEYAHSTPNGCAIIGGYVYRGAQFSKLWGLYLFSDNCSGRFWSLKQTSPGVFDPDTLQSFLINQYASFGEDNKGEIYVTGYANGRIYHLTDTSDCRPVALILPNDSLTSCSTLQLKVLQGDSLSYQWYDQNGAIDNALSSDYTVTQTGWYKVKVSKPAQGCESISDSIFASAYDTAQISAISPLLSYCITSEPITLSNNVSLSGGVFNGPAVSMDTFTPSIAPVGPNIISYKYKTLTGCESNIAFTIQIDDTTVFNHLVNDSVVCITSDTINLTSFITPKGGQFSGNGVVNDSLFVPSVVGAGTATVYYQYTNGSCSGQTSVTIEIHNQPQLIKVIEDTFLCFNFDFSPVWLNGFVYPTGGVYSGAGVANDTFSVSVEDIGFHTVFYFYTDSFGCSSMDSIYIDVSSCEGINDIIDINQFYLYPNPNDGNFELKVNAVYAQQASIEIADVVGKVCYREKKLLRPGTSTMPLSIGNISNGVYILKLETTEGSVSKRFVIGR